MGFEDEKDPANQPPDREEYEAWERERSSKFTPGPWEVHPPGSIVGHSIDGVVKRPGDFDWVCSVQCSNVPNWRANLQLISAAPDLLAACKAMVKSFADWDYADQHEVIVLLTEARNAILTKARAAIAKATGGPT